MTKPESLKQLYKSKEKLRKRVAEGEDLTYDNKIDPVYRKEFISSSHVIVDKKSSQSAEIATETNRA